VINVNSRISLYESYLLRSPFWSSPAAGGAWLGGLATLVGAREFPFFFFLFGMECPDAFASTRTIGSSF